MQIRKAAMNDLPDILAIYAYAREYMKEHGNPDQWKDNYPPLELTTPPIRSRSFARMIQICKQPERMSCVVSSNGG